MLMPGKIDERIFFPGSTKSMKQKRITTKIKQQQQQQIAHSKKDRIEIRLYFTD